MKFDRAVGEEIHLARIAIGRTLVIHTRVLFVVDRPKVEQRPVELGQSGQTIRAQIHVVKLELHIGYSLTPEDRITYWEADVPKDLRKIPNPEQGDKPGWAIAIGRSEPLCANNGRQFPLHSRFSSSRLCSARGRRRVDRLPLCFG